MPTKEKINTPKSDKETITNRLICSTSENAKAVNTISTTKEKRRLKRFISINIMFGYFFTSSYMMPSWILYI